MAQRSGTSEEQYSHGEEIKTCTKGVNVRHSTGSSLTHPIHSFQCSESFRSSVDTLISQVLQRTATIAQKSPVNLSRWFEQWSASVSDIVEHRHELIEEGHRKLHDLASSPAAEQVQTSLRRGVETLSASLRQAKSRYVKWRHARAQRREQTQTSESDEEPTISQAAMAIIVPA